MSLPLRSLLLSTLLFCSATFVHAQILVIANSSLKAAEVSSSDVREIFTGSSSTLKDGSRVLPVLLKAGTVNDSFLTLYVGKSDSAFRASWRNLLFSGQGVMPRTFESEAALIDFVARTPGAIGYVAKATPHDGVKILAVR